MSKPTTNGKPRIDVPPQRAPQQVNPQDLVELGLRRQVEQLNNAVQERNLWILAMINQFGEGDPKSVTLTDESQQAIKPGQSFRLEGHKASLV